MRECPRYFQRNAISLLMPSVTDSIAWITVEFETATFEIGLMFREWL